MSFYVVHTSTIIATVALVSWTLLRRRSRISILAAILGLALSLLALWPGPTQADPGESVEPLDFGELAKFKTAYLRNTWLYGNPIAPAQQRGGLLVQYFRFVRLEAHPEQPDSYYRLQLGLLGRERLEALGMQLDPNPVLAPIIVSYLAYHQQRGVDTLYAFGNPLTSSRLEGSKAYQVFERAWFTWPVGATDPSEVERMPIGLEVYNLAHSGTAAPATEWTALRQVLLVLATAAMLAYLAMLVVTGQRKRVRTRGLDF